VREGRKKEETERECAEQRPKKSKGALG